MGAKLGLSENRVLRRIFGPKRDEVTEDWRKLRNKELHSYSSSNIRVIIYRKMIWAGHVARMGEMRNSYKILVGRLDEKSPLGRPKSRWKDNITMDYKEIGGVD
jgi:hypothetical protein